MRRTATRLAAALGVAAIFSGCQSGTAPLSDASRCHGLFGCSGVPLDLPRPAGCLGVPLDMLIAWQAGWLSRGLPLSGKPTEFAVRDGRF